MEFPFPQVQLFINTALIHSMAEMWQEEKHSRDTSAGNHRGTTRVPGLNLKANNG
jgi:hypothetical protein